MSENINTEGFIGREIFDHQVSAFNRKHVVVKTSDLRAADNAHHKYVIEVWIPQECNPGPAPELVERCHLNFQDGGLDETGPNGISDQALLAVVLDRLRSFNDGPFRARENSIAITKIEEAMLWMQKRADDRARRGVEGRRLG